MIQFRLRDYLSVILYRVLYARSFARFGRGVRIIWPLRIVGSRYVVLGDGVTVQFGAYVAVITPLSDAPVLSIGGGTRVGNHAHIICTRRIEIGEKVLIADRVYISDNLHEYADVTTPILDQPLRQTNDVMIGAGSWIGENACIIGCKIGRNSVIGANSVVTRDIPDYCLARGSPAVPVKRYCVDTRRWRRTDPSGQFVD